MVKERSNTKKYGKKTQKKLIWQREKKWLKQFHLLSFLTEWVCRCVLLLLFFLRISIFFFSILYLAYTEIDHVIILFVQGIIRHLLCILHTHILYYTFHCIQRISFIFTTNSVFLLICLVVLDYFHWVFGLCLKIAVRSKQDVSSS